MVVVYLALRCMADDKLAGGRGLGLAGSALFGYCWHTEVVNSKQLLKEQEKW